MQITANKCETDAGFALPAAGHALHPGIIEKSAEARLSLSAPLLQGECGKDASCADFRVLTNGAGPWPTAPRVAAACRAGVLLSAFVLAACAPTLHLDAPAMPTVEMPPATARCTKQPVKTLAPLDSPPHLPDARQSPCPLGSGLAACFTLDQDIMRQQRFKILHDDRDYCRDAYQRAITPCVREK